MSENVFYITETGGLSYLSHHGILGQKWGVRRFQPYPSGYSGKGKEVGAARRTNRVERKEARAARRASKASSKLERVNADLARANQDYARASSMEMRTTGRKNEKAKKQMATAKTQIANLSSTQSKYERKQRLNTKLESAKSKNTSEVSSRQISNIKRDEKYRKKGGDSVKQQQKDVKAYSRKWKHDQNAVKNYIIDYGSYKNVSKAKKKNMFTDKEYNSAINRLLADMDSRANKQAMINQADIMIRRRMEAA